MELSDNLKRKIDELRITRDARVSDLADIAIQNSINLRTELNTNRENLPSIVADASAIALLADKFNVKPNFSVYDRRLPRSHNYFWRDRSVPELVSNGWLITLKLVESPRYEGHAYEEYSRSSSKYKAIVTDPNRHVTYLKSTGELMLIEGTGYDSSFHLRQKTGSLGQVPNEYHLLNHTERATNFHLEGGNPILITDDMSDSNLQYLDLVAINRGFEEFITKHNLY